MTRSLQYCFHSNTFIMLTFFLFISTGCNKNNSEPVNVRIVSVPTPLPTIPPNFYTINGIAILDIKGDSGVNTLTGIKVCLVDGESFMNLFNETKEQIVCRHICSLIYSIENEMIQLANKTESLSALLKYKEDEFSRYNSVKWSNFTYVDIHGKKYPNSSWSNNSTTALMMNNISELRYEISQTAMATQTMQDKMDDYLKEMISQNSAFNSIDDTKQFYTTLKYEINSFTQRASSNEFSQQQKYININNLMENIDECTVDSDYTNENGEFSFKVDAIKQYFIFAYHGDLTEVYYKINNESNHLLKLPKSYTWILQVPQQRNEYKRVVLSDSNSFDQKGWDRALRPEVVKSSFASWLRSFE